MSNRKRGKLFFMIGLPRSGKSTLCRSLVISASGNPKVIVCADDIRESMHGEVYRKEAETMVSAVEIIMIRALLKGGFDVYVDETNTSRFSIEKLLRIDIDATPIIMKADKDTCISRAHATHQSYLVPVIEKCAKNIENMGNVKEYVEKIREELRSE